jgi:Tfp pilus assembly protein FimT
MWMPDQLKAFGTRKHGIQGVKGSRVQVIAPEDRPLNPRILEPLNPVGMTLIEVIMMIVIIGILAATVLPRIDFGATSSRTSVDGAAYMIASDIRYAQEFAMANRVSKTVTFMNGSSVYTFNPASTGMDPSGQLQTLGATISTTVTFTFNSLGEPITGGGSSVTVSAGGVTRTITVLQYTGKVNIS